MSGLKKLDLKKLEKMETKKSAHDLVGYLNHPAGLDKESLEELWHIRALLLELFELHVREMNGGLILPDDAEMQSVNSRLARYKWITQLYVGDGRYLYFATDPAGGWWGDRDPHVQAQYFAKIVVELAEDSMLARVRPCSYCDSWFFGTGLYCSKKHKQAAYRSKPEFKAHARAYQKKYYRDELSPVTSRHAKKEEKHHEGMRKHATRKRAKR